MEKLRILLLNSLDIFGGGEQYVYQLAKSLLEKNHNIWVSCRADTLLNEKCLKENIPVFHVDYPVNSSSKLFKTAKKIAAFAKENKIQVIHTNTNYDRTAGAIAAWLAKCACAATVHSYHSIQHNLTHYIRNKYLINHFIADGDKIKSLLINKDGIPENKITSVYIGIDGDEMRRDKSAGFELRKKLSIAEESVVIGNVGRLVEFKGQEYLIRAFAEAQKEIQDIHLIIAGDGKLKKNLLELTEKLEVKQKVTFTGFFENLSELYSVFDIYAHTSIEGGGELFPISIINALAQGLPVIASDIGDVETMIKNGVNGYLVNEKDVSSIKDKIIKLCRNPELLIEFGRKSKVMFEEKFTLDKMNDSVIEIYKSILIKN
jgi:glycosyltransferase involved in cell wall biosynthesis